LQKGYAKEVIIESLFLEAIFPHFEQSILRETVLGDFSTKKSKWQTNGTLSIFSIFGAKSHKTCQIKFEVPIYLRNYHVYPFKN